MAGGAAHVLARTHKPLRLQVTQEPYAVELFAINNDPHLHGRALTPSRPVLPALQSNARLPSGSFVQPEGFFKALDTVRLGYSFRRALRRSATALLSTLLLHSQDLRFFSTFDYI